MSEVATEAAAPAETPEPLFTNEELRGFESDDVAAGRIICKMLSILFIYTLIGMSIVSFWTAAQE
jgi:hypothetical protein